MREVVIVDSVRTGLAKSFRGKFNLTRPDDMAAHCVDALLARNDLDPLLVDDCIVGAGSNEGAQGHNIGRNVAVLSGLGIQVPGMTLNRYCSSGLQAIAIAANQIASGCSEVIVAGGVESITLTLKSVNTDHLVNPLLQREVPGIYYPMGQTAEIVARRYGITREAQDAYALQSQQRMARAQADGLFADEIVPMTTRYAVEDKASGEKQVLDGVVDRDDCNRPDTTLEGLASLKPAFAEDGSVTAGNASQLSDGASMTLLMSLEKALALGLEPKAFFRGFTMPRLEPGMARIRVKDLRLRTFIGIKEEEILNKQDVLINLTILYPAADAVEVNDIEHALNYRTITKAIIRHVEENRFALLERMTQEILDLVMENPAVRYAEVEVDKPHALRFAESVSITLAGHR